MTERVDLFGSTYSHFTDPVLAAVRAEAFGVDIGQNSWTTSDELDRFLSWLDLTPDHHLLEVACGAGGPALHVARTAGCRVTGIDVNADGVAAAAAMAAASGAGPRAQFRVADATAGLPFAEGSFDAVLCVDSMNHFPDRLAVLREWRRVLRPGGRALCTDPVVVTGPVSNDELALRSSIGFFLFAPPGVNEQLIAQADLQLVHTEDVTANAALVSGRWHRAREARKDDMIRIEGAERFAGLQRFFAAVHRLTSERRLSRIAYVMMRN